MKKSVAYVLFILMMLGGSYSCEQSADDSVFTATSLRGKNEVKKKGTKIKPFKAHFFTKRNYTQEGLCDEAPFTDYNFQKGEGYATDLGEFTTEIFFCVDPDAFEYKNGSGVFVAANGDMLFFDVPSPGKIGKIKPIRSPDPLYEFRFKDPFIITGGTGRYEGASGGGKSDSHVDLFDDSGAFIPEHQTDHVWTGTLILP